MMRLTSLAVVAAAALLAACGSVTDSVKFDVPPQYTSAASLGPFMQVWESRDKTSMMMLMAIPSEIDLDKAMNSAQIKDAKIKKRERITICNGQKADYAELAGTTSTDIQLGLGAKKTTTRVSNIDFLATVANGKTYVAMYAWPLKDAPNPQSEAALRGLCAK